MASAADLPQISSSQVSGINLGASGKPEKWSIQGLTKEHATALAALLNKDKDAVIAEVQQHGLNFHVVLPEDAMFLHDSVSAEKVSEYLNKLINDAMSGLKPKENPVEGEVKEREVKEGGPKAEEPKPATVTVAASGSAAVSDASKPLDKQLEIWQREFRGLDQEKKLKILKKMAPNYFKTQTGITNSTLGGIDFSSTAKKDEFNYRILTTLRGRKRPDGQIRGTVSFHAIKAAFEDRDKL